MKLASAPRNEDEEREAFLRLDPAGFFIRHPPQPYELDGFITTDDELFQTIHMGAAVVDTDKWRLVVTGLVEKPYSLNLRQLKDLPSKTITSFHECYGSPLVPPLKALRRIGNVTWTGVPLHVLLDLSKPTPSAEYIWSEGLDRGSFGGVEADRYQKDLPIEKALGPEVLLAYEMNSRPLEKNRGGPVRLVVPGYFGTNSTKWLCKLDVQDRRASGPFVTTFYNERFPPDDPECESRPVWKVQPNSMIVRPRPNDRLEGPTITIEGWAWSYEPVHAVHVSDDEGSTWTAAALEDRIDFSWQKFRAELNLVPGKHTIRSRASSPSGSTQPLSEGRNHVHRVTIEVT